MVIPIAPPASTRRGRAPTCESGNATGGGPPPGEHGTPRTRGRRTTADAGESMPVTHRSDWPARSKPPQFQRPEVLTTARTGTRRPLLPTTSAPADGARALGLSELAEPVRVRPPAYPRASDLSERLRRTCAPLADLSECPRRTQAGEPTRPSTPVGRAPYHPFCPNTPAAAPPTCQPIMSERSHALAPDRQRAILAAEHTDGCPCRSSTA
jgi:hypothetical protein